MAMADETIRDLLLTGLKNAHAMERQAEETMERQVERMDDFPELQARLRTHLEETRQQIDRLERILEQQGSSASAIKDMATSFMGNMAALGHAMASDEVLKNTFANSALENYEIAAYKSLIAMSERAGLDIREPLEQSLREEQDMADWVDSHVEDITLQYLALETELA